VARRVDACVPFEGLRPRAGSATGVAAGRAASRGVVWRSECCMRKTSGAIGFPATAATLAVSGGIRAALLPAPSPVTLRSRVHPLVAFTPLQSTSASSPAPRLSARSTFLGVRGPSSRCQARVSTRRGSIPAVHPSAAFRTPSTFSPTRALAGLFHPATTSRVLPPGVCSSRTAAPTRRRPVCPLGVFRRRTTSSCPLAPSDVARPQGFAPCGNP